MKWQREGFEKKVVVIANKGSYQEDRVEVSNRINKGAFLERNN